MRRSRYLSVSSSSPRNDAAVYRMGYKCFVFTVLTTLMLVAGCVSNSARFSPMAGKVYPPKEESFEVAVFESVLPNQSFERIARIDVQMEVSASQEASLSAAIPELKRQARLAGADAIIDIRLQRSKTGESTLFRVSAMGIRYSQK
jgi:hypothetical protein